MGRQLQRFSPFLNGHRVFPLNAIGFRHQVMNWSGGRHPAKAVKGLKGKHRVGGGGPIIHLGGFSEIGRLDQLFVPPGLKFALEVLVQTVRRRQILHPLVDFRCPFRMACLLIDLRHAFVGSAQFWILVVRMLEQTKGHQELVSLGEGTPQKCVMISGLWGNLFKLVKGSPREGVVSQA